MVRPNEGAIEAVYSLYNCQRYDNCVGCPNMELRGERITCKVFCAICLTTQKEYIMECPCDHPIPRLHNRGEVFEYREGMKTEFQQRVEHYIKKYFDDSLVHSSQIGFCQRKTQAMHPQFFPLAPKWGFDQQEPNPSMILGTLLGLTANIWYPEGVLELDREVEIEGVRFQVHPDIYDVEKGRIIELKTTKRLDSLANSEYLFDAYLMQVHLQMLAMKKEEVTVYVMHYLAKETESMFEEIQVKKNALVENAIRERIIQIKTMPWYKLPLPPTWECEGCQYLAKCKRRFEE